MKDNYMAPFPIFILMCEHNTHADHMRFMLGIAARESIAITTQDRRDEPEGHWKALRGYQPNHARWLSIWEMYGVYWCSRGDGASDWAVSDRVDKEMRSLVDRHRQEQRVFKAT